MKSSARFASVLSYFPLAAGGLAAILQALAYLTSYDVNAHYFSFGSFLPTLAWVIALLGAVAGTLSALLTKPNPTDTHTLLPGTFSTIPACVGFLLAAVGILLISPKTTFTVLTSVLLMCAAVFCGLCILTPLPRAWQELLSLLGFSTVISTILLNAFFYFDRTVEMNAPMKVTVQMGLLCVMLYFTGELRYLLGTPSVRLFRILGSWVVSCGALAAVPVPLAFLCGKLGRTDYLAGALLVLGVCLTAALRLFLLLQRKEKQEEDGSSL